MKRYDYQVTAIVAGIKLSETCFWSASPKRAAARYMEEVGENFFYGFGAVRRNEIFDRGFGAVRRWGKPEDIRQLTDLFRVDYWRDPIAIEVQRLEIVSAGGNDDTVRRPVGKSRHYTWNGYSTTTRKGHIPALKEEEVTP